MKQKFYIFFFLAISFVVKAQIPAYYNDVNLNLTGLALKTELATKITNTHTTNLSYTPGVWDALKQTDLDPNNSANVFLIYGYNDVDGNYVTDKTRDKTLNGGTAGTEWNREHTYAKSLGTPDLGTSGPGADAHHLRAADITMNGIRGSLKYITGSGVAGISGSGWYPGDEWKGDVARMMMYMFLRYGNQCLPSGVAIGTANSTEASMINLLLDWNAADLVSTYETQRNPILESLQGNRNPFIDNPAFATQIWGGPQAEDLFTAAAANCTELFISEYIEGSGSNKYLEIYNPTASPIDLAAGFYDIVTYTNGSATVSNTLTLSGTVAAYGTFVIENSSETLAVTADLSTANAVMTFNGDDTIALRKATVNIDIIGQIGLDPGTQWSGVICTTGTADGGMRRNATVNTGDSDGSNAFDPDVEWTCVGVDVVSDLGAYTNNCATTEIDVQGNAVSIPSGTTATSVSNDTDFGSVDTAAGTIIKTFTILNTGGLDLTLTGNPVITGTNAGDFVVTTNPTSPITGGSSTTFQITFNPSADGTRTATVTIINNDADEGTYTFNISGTGTTGGAGCNELFFSEYIEGSGNNKYLEIYNPTASSIDLAAGSYDIVTYTNGSATVSNTLALTGTIAAYGTFVIENSSEALTVTADLSTANAVMTFNGDDTIALRKATVSIDIIGQIGLDPGTQWAGAVCTTGTADGGMRRNATVNTGDSNGADAFDPDTEWTCVAVDVVSDLGTYTNNCSTIGPEIDIQGNAVSIPSGTTATTVTNDTDFGSVDTASGTITKIFTILNTGTSVLTFTGLPTITGTNAADFVLSGSPTVTVLAGASTTFSIIFDPSADGIRTATVTILSDDTDEGTYTFNISGTGTTGGAGCNELFFSEYIEGSGNNKYLEIYNPTASSIDLAAGSYDIVIYVNGSATISNTLALSGTVTAYGTFVIENSSEALAVTADLSTANAVMTFNGDDTIALRKATVNIDIIGQIGLDPGTQWAGAVCTTGTADGGMRRNATVNAGDSNGADAFDPDAEWTCVAVDVVSDLGTYTNNCSIVSPEIDVQGNAISIVDGTIATSIGNDTDFGTANTTSDTIIKTFTILNTGTSVLTLSGVPIISGTNAADFSLTANPSLSIAAAASTTFSITFDPSADGIRTATITITNDDADEGTYTFNISGTGTSVAIDCTLIAATILNEDFEGVSAFTNTGTISTSTGNGLFPTDPKFVSGTQGLQVSNSIVSLTSATFDVSAYSNLSLTMRLASFAGTSGNGIDPTDYVRVFISTDNGATYSEELTVIGPVANNAKWSFISGTGVATTAYDGDNTTTSFQPAGGGDRTTDGYSTLTITGIPNSATLRIRVDVGNNSTNELWVFDDVVMTGETTSSTSWTGSWDNGTPINSVKAVVDNDYTMTTNADINTCEFEITTGNTLTVSAGKFLRIEGDVINNGTIIIEDGGSLLQVSPTATITGSGTYIVRRNTVSLPSEHVFTYWSSPLTSSTLAEVVPNADIYYSFNTGSQNWTVASAGTAMAPGVGYISKGPTDGNFPGTYTAAFTGSAFNNGDIVVGLTFNNDADADTDWNLVGNPYPSAIDADALISANPTIGGTIYFWTHNTDASFTQNFTQNDYVSWNGTGGIAGCSGCTVPTGSIASGQGFFIQALSTSNLTFTNGVRDTGNNTNFYRTSPVEKNRIWVNFSGENSFSQLLVGFFDEATNGIDRIFDGLRLDGGAQSNFYSVINNEPYGIQGKSALKEIEVIPLGFTVKKAGTYTISIDHLEGLLNDSEVILKDNQLNVDINLKNNDHTFSITQANTYNNRFTLNITTGAEVLDVKDFVDTNKLKIISSYSGLTVSTTNNSVITTVLVYDILGKKVAINKNASTTIRIKSTSLKANNIFIVKAVLENGQILVHKIYNN